MPSQQPPAPAPEAAPTTITALGDDLLREIFLHLPDLPSLVPAAFACRAFRRAVRSSPAFCRSFRARHPPPLIALVLEPNMEVVPLFPSRSRRSAPGLLAADFFGIHLSRQGDPCATGREIRSWNPSGEGYFLLMGTGSTEPRAAYSPLTQALGLFIYQPDYVSFHFHTLSTEYGQGPSHVVCVRHDRRLAESTAVVFSSHTMEWQISPKTTLPLFSTGIVVRGLIYWHDWLYDQIVLFDNVTCQFSRIDLPTALKTENEATYKLGETKDEKLCIVDIQEETLVSWFMTADDDSVVERWMVYKKFCLNWIVKKFTGCSMKDEGCHVNVVLVAVINGFVYLSIYYCKETQEFELYLSLCLETSEISELFKGEYRYNYQAHPYVMPWPSSLVQIKEEPETEFTGDNVVDDSPVCTEEASTVLVTALQSFRQALMNDSDDNKEIAAELDAFFGLSKDDEGSIIEKITTLDARLTIARDLILKIRA